MKSLYVMVALVVAAEGFQIFDIISHEWHVFKLEFKKQYISTEDELRHLKAYLVNRHTVAKHNRRFEMGFVSSRLKINEFSDIPYSEFNNKMNGFNRKASRADETRIPMFTVPHNVSLPDTIDWRELGAVTDVKNQRECRSCWAFSAAGALEGQLYRKYKKLITLSEQNLVDCTQENNGCYGGTMTDAYNYVMINRGIDKEDKYPYEGFEDLCRYNSKYSGGDDVGYVLTPEGDEMMLRGAVATVGPISVAVDASLTSFRLYSNGIYYDETCTNASTHAMLVVGYGTDRTGTDYWLLKNSWGKSWGESGYMRLARNRNNHCGIASYGSYPLV